MTADHGSARPRHRAGPLAVQIIGDIEPTRYRTLAPRWSRRQKLTANLHGHEAENSGYSQGEPYGAPRQSSTLPRSSPVAVITCSAAMARR